LSAQLIIREPLGERRLADEALPMSIGGAGSEACSFAPAEKNRVMRRLPGVLDW